MKLKQFIKYPGDALFVHTDYHSIDSKDDIIAEFIEVGDKFLAGPKYKTQIRDFNDRIDYLLQFIEPYNENHKLKVVQAMKKLGLFKHELWR